MAVPGRMVHGARGTAPHPDLTPPVEKQTQSRDAARRSVWTLPGARARAAPPASRSARAQGAPGRRDDLVVRHLADALGEVPTMSEGIRQLAVALAPERVG